MNNRADILLVQKGLATSREKAKEFIKKGLVVSGGRVVSKPSEMLDETAEIVFCGETLKYVGRGGLKLEKAVVEFSINLKGMVCADIGASTGGFTDCMLQNGAVKVYAVDVGHGQLAQKLLEDDRVVNLENLNVRYISSEHIPEKLDFISVDVSFISLRLVLGGLTDFLKSDGKISVLIKPQFEAGRENVGKKGIVKSEKAHVTVLSSLCDYFSSIGLALEQLTFSPIKGSDGNTEYLALLSKKDYNKIRRTYDLKLLVKTAFEQSE